MPTNVIMPALGIAQETGKLLQWLKTEGQPVAQGEILMVIETDKTTVEIEAPASGTLSQVTAKVGDEVPVGNVIAVILAPTEAAASHTPAMTAPTAAPQAAPQVPAGTPKGTIEASPLARRIAEENHVDLRAIKTTSGRIEKADVLDYIEHMQAQSSVPARLAPASPKARTAAAKRGIDLASIAGSGPGGAVVHADVAAVAQPKPAAVAAPMAAPVAAPVGPSAGAVEADVETIKPGTVWRIMAERTTQSWTSVPHFYLTREVSAARIMTWRERAQKRFADKITFTDLIVRLVAAALKEHPRVNAMWKDGTIVLHRAINIGLAVAVEDGLVVPVLQNADRLTIAQVARQRADLVGRAQGGKLRPDDISSGTFTISNLGMYGIDSFHAIVNPPQAAILAVGRIVQRVVPMDEKPAIQPMMTLTLSCDHRAIDGARGAQFIQTLADMIEEPLGLLD